MQHCMRWGLKTAAAYNTARQKASSLKQGADLEPARAGRIPDTIGRLNGRTHQAPLDACRKPVRGSGPEVEFLAHAEPHGEDTSSGVEYLKRQERFLCGWTAITPLAPWPSDHRGGRSWAVLPRREHISQVDYSNHERLYSHYSTSGQPDA